MAPTVPPMPRAASSTARPRTGIRPEPPLSKRWRTTTHTNTSTPSVLSSKQDLRERTSLTFRSYSFGSVNPSTLVVPDHARGERLDRWLSTTLPGMSRARIQSWIEDGHVLVDERPARASLTLRGGEQVTVVPQPLPSLRAEPEDLPLDILYIDDDLIAVNKPAGMTVHAGAGQHS